MEKRSFVDIRNVQVQRVVVLVTSPACTSLNSRDIGVEVEGQFSFDQHMLGCHHLGFYKPLLNLLIQKG